MTKEKTKIVYTSEHCCIRVNKLAKALMKTGKYEIHGLAKQISYGSQDFDALSFYHNEKQFKNLVASVDADIFLHANEPCHQLNWIREVRPDAKIILDAHDLDSIRVDIMPVAEHRAMTNCDGVLFVSRETQEFILDLHRDQLRNKPTEYVEHYCNEEFLTDEFNPPDIQRRGLVYEGGAQSPPYKEPHFKYRQVYKLFKKLIDQGHELHVMAGNPDVYSTFLNIGGFLYMPQVYPELMKSMRNFRWGLIVWNNPDHDQKQVNLTRTNKEQEYLACGLPIIVLDAPATAEYVKEKNVGLVFDKIEDIVPEALEEAYPEVKKNVDALRPELSMEKHIFKLEDLISKVLGKNADN